MKIINPSVEYIPQEGKVNDGVYYGEVIKGIYKHIERCGRTCYKSEDKITEGSAEAFVQRMIESNHTAMLEHGTVYMMMSIDTDNRSDIRKFSWYYNNKPAKYQEIFGYVQTLFIFNPYSVVNLHHDRDTDTTIMCITTNYRVIIENHWEDIMKEFISDLTQYHTPRITLKFTTNIGVTREGNRMRANSIAEESTRYCNYTKEKFGNQLNVCSSAWMSDTDIELLNSCNTDKWLNIIRELCDAEQDGIGGSDNPIDYYGAAIAFSNICYNKLIFFGWKPQQAREVLPLATKSDVVYTAFPHQWRHFFDLRLFGKTGIPHPNMKAIASLARDILCEKDLWYLIYRPDEPEFSAHQVEENKTV